MPDTYRTIEGEIRFLEKTNEFLFPLEIWMLNDKLTLNGWRFDNLESHREAWAGVPVLCAYVDGGTTIGSGHNQETKIDKNGQSYQSFTDSTAERIVGATSDSAEDIRIEERDGAKWIVGKATLWAWYSHELCEQIANWAQQGRTMSVSIEALVTESYMDGEVEVETAYKPLGVTLLGYGVQPAVPGAHVAMLSEMESEFKELKLRAASYREQQSENKPQNNPKRKGVNKRMNFSKQQLKELQEKFGADYKVLSARKAESVIRVMLMRKSDYVFCSYDMDEKDTGVYPEKFVTKAATIVLSAEEGEDAMCADAGETICEECAEAAAAAKSAEDRAECAEKELSAAKDTIAKMEAAENARRLNAAKAKATATLDAFNACREEKVEVKALEALTKEIESGKFTALCNENGEWIGESAVEEKVLSLCAAAVMEQDKRNAASAAKPMTWGSVKQASANPGTIGELFASKN